LNKLEKKSFYLFLSLYIISSTLFILLSGYLYNSSQKNSLEKNEYYLLQHISDTISQKIIHAHMNNTPFELPHLGEKINIALIDVNDKVITGKLLDNYSVHKPEYTIRNKYNIVVSDAPQEHLNVKYVVVYSNILYKQLKILKRNIIAVMIFSIFIIIILAWLLSKLFMRPLQERIKQVEDFVHDTAHELNTPITALSMSVSRALKKEVYDEKNLRNISISTKQLFDIYNALSYLSFEPSTEVATNINICKVLKKSVAYYKELAQSKMIEMELKCEDFEFKIDEAKLTMLFGNLINNAIKYSNQNSRIIINFENSVFSIQDFGIGIEDTKKEKIYDRFNRATNYAGGFGIGLSIVKKISDEYGLKLTLDSEINKGSTFSIKF